MSESQISAVMATVHSSINGDEVNKTGLCLDVRFAPGTSSPWSPLQEIGDLGAQS